MLLVFALGCLVICSPVLMAFASDGSDGATVDNSVWCVSGQSSTKLLIYPDQGRTASVSSAFSWLVIGTGTACVSVDGGEPESCELNGASLLPASLEKERAHTVVWTMPDGSEHVFNLKVGSVSVSMDEDGAEIDEYISMLASELESREKNLVFLAILLSLATCALFIGYRVLKSRDEMTELV